MIKFVKFFDMNSYGSVDGEKVEGSLPVACLNKFIELNPGIKILSVNHTASEYGECILVQVQASHDLEYPRKNGQGLVY